METATNTAPNGKKVKVDALGTGVGLSKAYSAKRFLEAPLFALHCDTIE